MRYLVLVLFAACLLGCEPPHQQPQFPQYPSMDQPEPSNARVEGLMRENAELQKKLKEKTAEVERLKAAKEEDKKKQDEPERRRLFRRDEK